MILAFSHKSIFSDFVKYKDSLTQIKAENNFDFATQAFIRTISKLTDGGKKVIVLYGTPFLTVEPNGCIDRPFTFIPKDCRLDHSSMRFDDFRQYDNMIASAKLVLNFEVFDTRKFMGGNFPIDKNGVLMFRDSVHLSKNGSLFFSDKYFFK